MYIAIKRLAYACADFEFTSWLFERKNKIMIGVQKVIFSKVEIIGGRLRKILFIEIKLLIRNNLSIVYKLHIFVIYFL